MMMKLNIQQPWRLIAMETPFQLSNILYSWQLEPDSHSNDSYVEGKSEKCSQGIFLSRKLKAIAYEESSNSFVILIVFYQFTQLWLHKNGGVDN